MSQFLVEDGTGVAGATSYASTEAADDYATFWDKPEWLVLDEVDKQKALIKATVFLDTSVSYPSRILTQEQGLLWPREPFRDLEGRVVQGLPAILIEVAIRIAIAGLTYDLYTVPKVLVSQAFATTRETYLGGYIENPSPEYTEITQALRQLSSLGIGSKKIKQVTLERG